MVAPYWLFLIGLFSALIWSLPCLGGDFPNNSAASGDAVSKNEVLAEIRRLCDEGNLNAAKHLIAKLSDRVEGNETDRLKPAERLLLEARVSNLEGSFQNAKDALRLIRAQFQGELVSDETFARAYLLETLQNERMLGNHRSTWAIAKALASNGEAVMEGMEKAATLIGCAETVLDSKFYQQAADGAFHAIELLNSLPSSYAADRLFLRANEIRVRVLIAYGQMELASKCLAESQECLRHNRLDEPQLIRHIDFCRAELIFHRGQASDALQMYQRISESLRDRRESDVLVYATSQCRAVQCLVETGEFDRAYDCAKTATEFLNVRLENAHPLAITSLATMGHFLGKSMKYESVADEMVLDSLRRCPPIGETPFFGGSFCVPVYILNASRSFSKDKIDLADDFLVYALQELGPEPSRYPDLLSQIMYWRSKVEIARGNRTAAEKCLATSIDLGKVAENERSYWINAFSRQCIRTKDVSSETERAASGNVPRPE
jgi:tetratricopeptide (TPR) repeat protein